MCSIGSNSTVGIGALSKGAIGGGNSIGGAAASGTLMGGSVARLSGGTSSLLGREPVPANNSTGGGYDSTGRGRGPTPNVRSY